MKKVLIIAYALPSKGSFRPLPLAKYLPEFGWQPFVLMGTAGIATDSQFTIVETLYRDHILSRLKQRLFKQGEGIGEQLAKRLGMDSKNSLIDSLTTLAAEIFYYPDSSRGWQPFALKAGKTLLEKENIAAIISHHPPAMGHIVASKLKAIGKIPWLADFPDLWSENHNYPYGRTRKWFDTILERKTLSRADALVTVSRPWAEKLAALHQGKVIQVIPHGFDPAEVNSPPAVLTTKFTITYTGKIYLGKQDPSKLLQSLRDLISAGALAPNDLEVRFYGERESWLAEDIERYGLSPVVKQYGRVSKQASRQKQRESQLLLLLDWEDAHDRGVYTSKVFEYLGARRPILATGGSRNDVVEELLNETGAGTHAPSLEDIKETIKGLYQEYKLMGEVVYRGKESQVNQYSHREMARKFSQVLDSLVLSGQPA